MALLLTKDMTCENMPEHISAELRDAVRKLAKHPEYYTIATLNANINDTLHMKFALYNALSETVSCQKYSTFSFTNALIESIMNRREDEFRREAYRPELLIIDDFHDLEGKEATQLEFYHIAKQRMEEGKLTVFMPAMSMDRLQSFNSELYALLMSGLSADGFSGR